MKISLLIALTLIVFGQSCENDQNLSESYDFPETHQWQKSEPKTFTFTIENAGTFNGVLMGSFVYGSQFSKLPLALTVSNEEKTEKQPLTLLIKNAKGEECGDCTGDVCDVKQTVFTAKHFDPGTYTFTLENTFEYPYFPNIIALGMELERVK